MLKHHLHLRGPGGIKTDILVKRNLIQLNSIFKGMGSNIVSISIYTNNQRVKLTPDTDGMFLVPNSKTNSFSKPLIKVTAVQLVSHPKIKYMDPVLTLDDGSKLRVFQGGDPTAILTLAISLLEKHDKKFKKKIPVFSKSMKKKKVITILDAPFNNVYVNPDYDDYDYPWDDPNLYDDAD